MERLVPPALPLCMGSTAPVVQSMVLLARWAVPTPRTPILPACHPGHEPKAQIHSEPQGWGLEWHQSMRLSSLEACCSGFAWPPALQGRQWVGRGTNGHMGSSEGAVGWECRHLCPISLSYLCKEQTCAELSCRYPVISSRGLSGPHRDTQLQRTPFPVPCQCWPSVPAPALSCCWQLHALARTAICHPSSAGCHPHSNPHLVCVLCHAEEGDMVRE